MSWRPVNLAAPEYTIRPEPPKWCGLIYAGKRHLISGPPESAKTLFGWIVALEAMRNGATVAMVDFEMGAHATRLMLEELGATPDEISSVYYVEPDHEPGEDDLQALLAAGVDFAVIDAAAGAYDASGLDDNKRGDVEKFARLWVWPLWQAGVTTLLLDHVTKLREGRGKFSIGSERKVGAVDVHLGLEDVHAVTRGGTGLYKVHVHKDRPGYLRRPIAAELELRSDPDTHAITWQLREPAAATAGADHWKPTFLMGRVSNFLADQAEPVSFAHVERNVTGKSRKHIRQAIDELIAAGNVTEQPGPRNARMLTLTRPFLTSPDLAPTSPGEVRNDLAHLAYPLQGGEVRGEDEDELNHLIALGDQMGLT